MSASFWPTSTSSSPSTAPLSAMSSPRAPAAYSPGFRPHAISRRAATRAIRRAAEDASGRGFTLDAAMALREAARQSLYMGCLLGSHDSPAAWWERSDHLLSGADKSCTPDTGRREPLDEDPVWTDPRAHRANRLASDMRANDPRSQRAGSTIGAGASVTVRGGHGW